MPKRSLTSGERIRVLQVVPNFAVGGAERCVVQLMCALDPSRFDVAAVSLYGRQNTELEAILAAHWFPVTFLQKKRGLDLAILGRVVQAVRLFRPHVIHTHLQAFNYTLPVILRREVPAVVHTVHSVAERERRRLGKWMPKLLFTRVVTPVAIATEVQTSIRRVLGVDSFLIPNGIPLSEYCSPRMTRQEWRQREGFRTDDVIFVCVARFDRVKNHEMLINAFELVSRYGPKSHLVLVGDGELRSRLEGQVEALNLREHVHFLGVRKDIPTILNASDVYAFASDQEGSPLSVMEAMAAGLPIVGTSVGGVPEMVPEGRAGILTEPHDPESLATSLTFMYQNEEQRAVMGRSAAENAARFDVARMADGYGTLYSNLLKQ